MFFLSAILFTSCPGLIPFVSLSKFISMAWIGGGGMSNQCLPGYVVDRGAPDSGWAAEVNELADFRKACYQGPLPGLMPSANYNWFLNKIVFNLLQRKPRQSWQRTVENCLPLKILFFAVGFVLGGLLLLLALDQETLTSLAFIDVTKQAEYAEEVWEWCTIPSGYPLGTGLDTGYHRKMPLAPKIRKCRSLCSTFGITCSEP